MKGNAVLERVSLLGNPVTKGVYGEDAQVGTEDGRKYRAILICHIGASLQALDGVSVSERELAAALDMEHRGELISIPSAMSSIEVVPASQDVSIDLVFQPTHAPRNSVASEVFTPSQGTERHTKKTRVPQQIVVETLEPLKLQTSQPSDPHIAQKTQYKSSRRHIESGDYYRHYSNFASLLDTPVAPVRSHTHHKRHRVKVLREVGTSTHQSIDLTPAEVLPVKPKRKQWKGSMDTDVSSHKAGLSEEWRISPIKAMEMERRQNLCRTPETPRGALIPQLVRYACTPSRPVLSSESSTPIHCTLSPKGSEYALILRLLGPYPVSSVLKTYTFQQQCRLMGLDTPSCAFLSRHAAMDKLTVMFFRDSEERLKSLCFSSTGFPEIYKKAEKSLIFSPEIAGVSRCKTVLLSLVDLGRTYEGKGCVPSAEELQGYQSVKLSDDLYHLLSPAQAVPVYLISMASA